MTDVDGLNSGYERLLLEDYLENPDAVPSEWRSLFESGDSELVATHPGLARLLERLTDGSNGGSVATVPAPAPPSAEPVAPPAPEPEPPPAPADRELLGGVAAAMA